jgi:hypothetical protein
MVSKADAISGHHQADIFVQPYATNICTDEWMNSALRKFSAFQTHRRMYMACLVG